MTVTQEMDRLRAEVLAVLLTNGYVELPTPLVVGDISLNVGLVCEGPPESLDVALVAERPPTREAGLQLYWHVQRLARALDAINSRRTITVIIVGGTEESKLLNDLLGIARVLVVDQSLPVERMLSPLARLELQLGSTAEVDGLRQVSEFFRNAPDGETLRQLIGAATIDIAAVSERYAAWVDDAFSTEQHQGSPRV